MAEIKTVPKQGWTWKIHNEDRQIIAEAKLSLGKVEYSEVNIFYQTISKPALQEIDFFLQVQFGRFYYTIAHWANAPLENLEQILEYYLEHLDQEEGIKLLAVKIDMSDWQPFDYWNILIAPALLKLDIAPELVHRIGVKINPENQSFSDFGLFEHIKTFQEFIS